MAGSICALLRILCPGPSLALFFSGVLLIVSCKKKRKRKRYDREWHSGAAWKVLFTDGSGEIDPRHCKQQPRLHEKPLPPPLLRPFSLLDEVLFITSHSELYITGAVTRAFPGNISCGRRPLWAPSDAMLIYLLNLLKGCGWDCPDPLVSMVRVRDE